MSEEHIAEKDAGQTAFQALVENNLRLGAAIDLALEASYWDRPYDTRIDAIRQALHAARGEHSPGSETALVPLAVTRQSPGGKSLTYCCCDRTTARLVVCPAHPDTHLAPPMDKP